MEDTEFQKGFKAGWDEAIRVSKIVSISQPAILTLEQAAEINGILYEPGTYIMSGKPPWLRT